MVRLAPALGLLLTVAGLSLVEACGAGQARITTRGSHDVCNTVPAPPSPVHVRAVIPTVGGNVEAMSASGGKAHVLTRDKSGGLAISSWDVASRTMIRRVLVHLAGDLQPFDLLSHGDEVVVLAARLAAVNDADGNLRPAADWLVAYGLDESSDEPHAVPLAAIAGIDPRRAVEFRLGEPLVPPSPHICSWGQTASGDGATRACGSDEGVLVWRVGEGLRVPPIKAKGALTLSDDGSALAVAPSRSNPFFTFVALADPPETWHPADLDVRDSDAPDADLREEPATVALSADGRFAVSSAPRVSALPARRTELFDMSHRARVRLPQRPYSEFAFDQSAAFVSSRELLVSSGDGHLDLRDAATGALLTRLGDEASFGVTGMAVGERTLAVARQFGTGVGAAFKGQLQVDVVSLDDGSMVDHRRMGMSASLRAGWSIDGAGNALRWYSTLEQSSGDTSNPRECVHVERAPSGVTQWSGTQLECVDRRQGQSPPLTLSDAQGDWVSVRETGTPSRAIRLDGSETIELDEDRPVNLVRDATGRTWALGDVEVQELRTGGARARIGTTRDRMIHKALSPDATYVGVLQEDVRLEAPPSMLRLLRLPPSDAGATETGGPPAASLVAEAELDRSTNVTAITVTSDHSLVAATSDGKLLILGEHGGLQHIATEAGTFAALSAHPSRPVVAVLNGDRTGVQLWDVALRRHLTTTALFGDGENLTFTPLGAFTGSREAASRIAWVFDHPSEGYRFEQFAREFERPAVVARRLSGEDADLRTGPARPPRVEIRRTAAAGDHVTASVHVSSASLVETVTAFVDGKPQDPKRVCAPEADVDLDIPLLPGRNTVSIVATDALGETSNETSVTVDGRAGDRPALWVVSVGIDDYSRLPSKWKLAYAVSDARAIRDAFGEFVKKGFFSDATNGGRLLINGEATPASIDVALSQLAQMRADDLAVVFFAGHGIVPAPGRDMLFLTAETEATSESVEKNGIAWATVGRRLAEAHGRVLVLLDACRSGHFNRELIAPSGTLVSELVESRRAGSLVFAAARGNQDSYESDGAGITLAGRGLSLELGRADLTQVVPGGVGAHGLFTGALLLSLRSSSKDRNGDGLIQASELTEDVTTRLSQATGGRQTPWVARREMFGDFAVGPSALTP